MASMKSEEETNHNMEQKQTGGGAEGHDGNDAELESKVNDIISGLCSCAFLVYPLFTAFLILS